MSENRFVYQEGEIQFGKTQCSLCVHDEDHIDGLDECCCIKYPFGKPDAVINGIHRCKYLELK